MAAYKKYEAIIMSTMAVDALIEAALDVNGEVTRRGDSLAYQLRCNNREDLEKFQLQFDGEATHWHDSSDIPESTAQKLLADQLKVKIVRLFVDGTDQIIICSLN